MLVPPVSEIVLNAGLTGRKTDIFTIGELDVDLIRPERLRVKLNDEIRATPIDFGCLCYLKRERLLLNSADQRKIVGREDYVDLESFQPERVTTLVNLIDSLLVKFNRESTIEKHFRDISYVFSWADSNGFSDFLLSPDIARDSFIKYVDHLFHLVNTDQSKPYSLLPRQATFIKVMEACFGKSNTAYITRGIIQLKGKSAPVEAPGEKDVLRYLDTVYPLAVIISDALVNGDPFPFHLKFSEFSTFYFPSAGRNVKTPYTNGPAKTFSFEKGRIVTAEEYAEKSPNAPLSECKRTVLKSENALRKANENLRHGQRLQAAALAMKAWASTFQFIMGANNSVFCGLEFDSSIDVIESAYKRELSGIKFRANGRTIRLPIGSKKGIYLFRKYLKFRKWLVNGEDCNWLFFLITGGNGTSNRRFRKLPESYQSSFYEKSLKGVYLPDNSKNVTSTMARKYKSSALYKLKVTPSVVSGLLGHKPVTNFKHYAEPNVDQQKEEFGNYWAATLKAAERIKLKEASDKSEGTSTTTGHCDDFGAPESIVDNPAVEPNCKTQNGCLFCKNYTCHADETDVHKLLSLKYVIGEVMSQSEDIRHVDNLLSETADRINVIIGTIEKQSETHREMVDVIVKQVFSLGILTPFWEKRLLRYESMGVVL